MGELTPIKRPVIIAHRGASGYRPEHTIAAYELAINMGADYIEPDLVFTKDGHLVCRHENEISLTTDVAKRKEFENRKITKKIDGKLVTGWFTEDFTLAEIKTLRCIERLPELRNANCRFDEMFTIPTFQEVLELRSIKSLEKGRVIGVYPETKHPSYYKALGYDFNKPLLKLLNEEGLNKHNSPVYIQSFETENLKQLSKLTAVKLIQLLAKDGGPYDKQSGYTKTYDSMATPDGLSDIYSYAVGIGPEKTMIFPIDENGNTQKITSLLTDAKNAKLKVHPWTFRLENHFLANEYKAKSLKDNIIDKDPGYLVAEIKAYFDLDIDGIFCDFADIAYDCKKTIIQED